MIPIQFATYKYLSLLIGVVTAFVQVGLYVRNLREGDVAFLMVITSYATFISWFDAGFGRPLYATLRKEFLENKIKSSEVLSAICIYVLLGLISIVIFCAVICILSSNFDLNISLKTVFMFGASVAIASCISFFNSIYAAVDEYSRFELIELGKRASNLGTSFLILYDSTFYLTALTILMCNAILYIETIRFLVGKYYTQLSYRNLMVEMKRLIAAHKKESSQYFVFMINESLIYNWGYLITPFLLSTSNIVLFGLWMRLFSGMASFSRSVADITIHSITKNFFSGKLDLANTERKRTILLTVVISTLMVAFFALFADPIMNYWVDGKYVIDGYLLLALFVLLISNSIQHVAGTVLVSLGNHFKKLRNMSAILCGSVLVGTTAGTFAYSTVVAYVFVFALIYLVGAFWYESVSRSVFED